MNVSRFGSYNKRTIVIVLAVLLLLVLTTAYATGFSFFGDDDRLKNLAVSRPSEIYIARDGLLTRVDSESRWFERFWLLADSSVKSDTGSNVPANLPAIDVSSTGFLRGNDPNFVPSIIGFKRLKSDSSIKFSKTRRFILLLYNKPTKIVVANDKTAESHQAEIALLGYPINKKGVHWIRYMLLESDSIAQDYNLFVEGTSPYWDPQSNITSIGTGYHRQYVNKEKYDLDKELKSTIDSYGRWWPW